jgi:RimJ/RimL family protein N-acetyltransferase
VNERNIILETDRVRLEPLTDRHLPSLIAAGNDPRIWELTYNSNPFTSDAETRAWFEFAIDSSDKITFAIVDKASGTAIGSTRLFDIEPAHRKMEIGWTWIAQRFWRTHVNTESKYLLLRHAFETWHANRVQLKGEAINLRSRNAMTGIGATYEGTLRAYRVHPSGDIRDTSFYSIIAPEWPDVKSRLEARLHGHTTLNA